MYIYNCLKKARIAYITETSWQDKHAWSGTAHYVYRALSDAGYEMEALGPVRPGFIRLLFAAFNKLSLTLFNKRFDYRHSVAYSKAYGKLFTTRLNTVTHDMVVVCGATEYGAYLKSNKPVIYVLDRTIAGALNYHHILSDLWSFSRAQSVLTDKKAMLASAKVLFSSTWAAQHAVKHYGLTTKQFAVIPFGANLDKIPDRITALKKKDTGTWKLLLIGTYWYNKGADIAFNTLVHLLENNINASLTVVGCQPPTPIQHERLTIIPFIDKNSERGISELWLLFQSHHFFILPTRFDCTPIVFCEASAFGLPVLSANTGGVEGHIKEGVNGYLLPYEDKGKAYAEKIMELVSNPERYQRLCESSRNHYEQELNWTTWAQRFEQETKSLLE